MKIKRITLIIVLGLTAVIIWRLNLRFFSRLQAGERKAEEFTVADDPSPLIAGQTNYEFMPLKRDPFNAVADTTPREPAPPRLSLIGIVISRGGALALMARTDGSVFMMKKGETYQGLRIIDILPKQVTVDYRGKRDTLVIAQ